MNESIRHSIQYTLDAKRYNLFTLRGANDCELSPNTQRGADPSTFVLWEGTTYCTLLGHISFGPPLLELVSFQQEN